MASKVPTTTPQSGDVFPLTKLAPDIQYIVFQSLCYHCGKGENDAMAMLDHDPCEQTQALRNLCLTSKHTKSLAEHILYHFPRIYSYTNFFQTIRARSDLASQVKVVTWVYKEDVERFLLSRRSDTTRDRTPRENIQYLRDLAKELKLSDTGLEFIQTFFHYPQSAEDDVDVHSKQEMHKAFDNLITSLLLGLCPRLEFAFVNLDDGQENSRYHSFPIPTMRFQYLPGLVLERPNGFPSLRTLVVHNTRHADPNALGIDSISFLWKSLPNLQRLIFFRRFEETCPVQPSQPCKDQFDREPLPNLKELRFVHYSRFDRPLPLPAITELVSRCTQLEQFAFSPMALQGVVFPPSQLIRAIAAASCTLRRLVINCLILESSSVDASQLITDLRQFTQLQSVVLDQSVFCRHHHYPNADAPPDCLTRILPASICRLTINMHSHKMSPCAPVVDLLALGAAAANGSFPHLQHLRVQMIYADLDVDYVSATGSASTSVSDIDNSALLAPPDAEMSCPKRETQQMLLTAFAETAVVLDVDCYSGDLCEPSAADWRPPHELRWRFSTLLVRDEL